MKLIEQKHGSSQCGQCCLAMVTGHSLQQVISNLGKWRSTTSKDLCSYIIEHYNNESEIVDHKFQPFETVPSRSTIYFEYPKSGGHFIVKYNDEYYDPLGRISSYLSDKNNKVINYITF